MKTKSTNKCKLCGKRYKLPLFPDSVREVFCATCENGLDSWSIMKTVMLFVGLSGDDLDKNLHIFRKLREKDNERDMPEVS